MHPAIRHLVSAFLVLASLSVGWSAQAEGWEVINREQGIKVSRFEVEGRNLPKFRGNVTVNASLYLVLAVLSDFEKHNQWMHACRHARLLKRIDTHNVIHYNRTRAPWPVSDRDSVLKSKVIINAAKKRVTIKFHAIKSALQGPTDAVRMPRLKGYYRLTALGPNKTAIQYQVDADPGGLLPDWVAKMTSEDIPLNTLTNLRNRLKTAKPLYTKFLTDWDPATNAEAFPLE